jgi:hypothetical protein
MGVMSLGGISANFDETPTGDETVLTLRHMAQSFEPVTVTVTGIVIIVDLRKMHVL